MVPCYWFPCSLLACMHVICLGQFIAWLSCFDVGVAFVHVQKQ